MPHSYDRAQQPIIVKYVQPGRTGVRAHALSRHCIGYVAKGRKYIYSSDTRHEIKQGEVFYLAPGVHYMEEVPDQGRPFKQILFYYTPELLGRILSHLNLVYRLDFENDHTCPECQSKDYVIVPACNAVKNFFAATNQYIRENLFPGDLPGETIKFTELIYLILTQPLGCLRNKVLSDIDMEKENFEQVIRSNIFSDISIESLAAKSNRSTSSFKKEFRRLYNHTPHRWFMQQRLAHSRLLLISTHKSVSEIGSECRFPNTSHFIKLFKKEYGTTPAQYRNTSKIAQDQSSFAHAE